MTQDKPDLSAFMPEGWEGAYPPCQIQVNSEGELHHFGAPIIHPGVREIIFASVIMEGSLYLLRKDGKTCQLEVEDTFFVVRAVDFHDSGATVTLNDGNSEPLDPATLYIGQGEVLYCRVRAGAFPARFLRQAYYQLAQRVEEEDGGFVLKLAGQTYALKSGPEA